VPICPAFTFLGGLPAKKRLEPAKTVEAVTPAAVLPASAEQHFKNLRRVISLRPVNIQSSPDPGLNCRLQFY
jgi:hypothetical protein